MLFFDKNLLTNCKTQNLFTMVYFKAFIFQGKRTARRALDTIEDNYPDAGKYHQSEEISYKTLI